MDNPKKIFLTISTFFLLSGTSMLSSSCCEVLNGADLLLDVFSTTPAGQSNTGGIVYDVSQTILNSVKGMKCTDDDDNTAGPHSDNSKIYYSSDGSFDNPTTVADKNFDITDPTKPSKKYTIINNIEFAVDGFYDLDGLIDVNKEVDERNRDNNTYRVGVGKNGSPRNVIHVTGTGNTSPTIGKDGKPVYINSWKIEVVHHD